MATELHLKNNVIHEHMVIKKSDDRYVREYHYHGTIGKELASEAEIKMLLAWVHFQNCRKRCLSGNWTICDEY